MNCPECGAPMESRDDPEWEWHLWWCDEHGEYEGASR